jgi:hypothetical protein
MGLIDHVTTGKIEKPWLILAWGIEGIGKSSFAADSPSPIFIAAESGTNNLDVARFDTPKRWADVMSCLEALAKEKHDFRTVVLDTLDWLEMILHSEICRQYKVRNIEHAAGGYGKGYGEAFTLWQEMKNSLDILRNDRGMNVILIAHSEIKDFFDPQLQVNYNRYQIKLHKKATALWKEYVDAILFATFKTYPKEESGKKTKVFSDGDRVMFTEGRPQFEAKNRFGLPFELPLSWTAFVDAATPKSDVDSSALYLKLKNLAEQIKEEDLKDKVLRNLLANKLNNNFLLKAETRILEILN